MINSDYSKAYSEVLEIISALPRSEYNKIPIKYIEYLEENADRSEGFKYNIGLPFDRQNVSEEAKDVLSVIYRLFLADNETKKYLSNVDRGLISDIKKCNENEIRKEEEPKYRQLTKTAIMVVKKPTLFKRFVNKLKKWFRF